MLDQISTRIFADGADLDGILALAADPRIAGFTTNPTLMWKAGLTDYAEFAQRLLERITKHPISFEVFADEPRRCAARRASIASWGENVYVKIPVTTTNGESMAPLVRELSEDGVKVNVTALFTTAQVELITAAVKDGAPSYISVFAGRIADAGVDPVPIMARSVDIMVAGAALGADLGIAARDPQPRAGRPGRLPHHHDHARSAQEARLARQETSSSISLETVQMFHGDAVAAGFTL